MFLPHEGLSLRDKTPLIEGTHRVLYEVDGAPHLVVKVMRRRVTVKPRNFVKLLKYRFRDRYLPSAHYRFLYREYKTYIDIKLAQEQRRQAPPIAELRGLVQTDLGMGMLAEKIVSRTGALASTVHAMFLAGELDRHLAGLTHFARSLFDWNLRVNDLNSVNIVLGWRGGHDEFVIIDGLGDSNIVPIRSWSTRANRRSLEKRLARMADRLALRWVVATREFASREP
jgi:hypothetical protein